MNRFFVEPIGEKEITARIVGEDVNHIRNVLRMRIGEEVMLCDGAGMEYLGVIEEISSSEVCVAIRSRERTRSELPVKLVLFQGLPKKDKMDLIVQKAVELGVSEIVPVMTKRVIVKLEDPKKEAKKLERWNAIAKSAAEQSGRGVVPVVRGVISYKEAVKEAAALDYAMIPYEKARGMRSLKEAACEIAKASSAGILIGPEGGFEESEVLEASGAGIRPVSLGSRILRTETAGLAALSVVG